MMLQSCDTATCADILIVQPVCNRKSQFSIYKSLSQLPHHHLESAKGLTYDRVENCVSHSPAQ